MILRSLSTRNFRNLEPSRIDFDPSANVFVGPNGQGKTNYLEAIYIVATTKSFRTKRVPNVIRFDGDHLFVEGVIERDGIERKLSIGIDAAANRRRELLVNGHKTPLERYVEELPVFAYSSSRLEVLRGSPEVRRKFLDRGIASIRRGYIRELSKYARTLKQRNALFDRVAEGSTPESALDPWDYELAETGKVIVEARKEYVETLTKEFGRVTGEIDYHVDDLSLIYEPSGAFTEDVDRIVASLRNTRRRELMAGFSLSGPHRDTLRFETREREASEVLSSGEIKMTVLFLKLAKIAIYNELVGDRPVFVFDDIDAELDLAVTERLMALVGTSVQLFTSSAKEEVLDRLDLGSHKRFKVANGVVS